MDGVSNKKIYDLELIQKDKTANTLLLIGVLIAYNAFDLFEQSILGEQPQQSSDQAAAASTQNPTAKLATANWFYAVSALLFLSTAKVRLGEDITSQASAPSLSNQDRVLGRELVVLGNVLKALGFTSIAVGNEIIAGSG